MSSLCLFHAIKARTFARSRRLFLASSSTRRPSSEEPTRRAARARTTCTQVARRELTTIFHTGQTRTTSAMLLIAALATHGGGGGYHTIPGGATGFGKVSDNLDSNSNPRTLDQGEYPVEVKANCETVAHHFFGMKGGSTRANPRWYYGVHPAAPADTLSKFGMGVLPNAISNIFGADGIADLADLILTGEIELRMLEPRPKSSSSADRVAVRVDRLKAQPRFSGRMLSEALHNAAYARAGESFIFEPFRFEPFIFGNSSRFPRWARDKHKKTQEKGRHCSSDCPKMQNGGDTDYSSPELRPVTCDSARHLQAMELMTGHIHADQVRECLVSLCQPVHYSITY